MWGLTVKPVIVRSEEQVVGALRWRREKGLGWTQPELDDRVGFAEGYSAKLEAPDRGYGRRALWGMADSFFDWLQGLGLVLVIMPRAQAEALIAASTEAEPEVLAHQPYPGRSRNRPLVRRTILRTRLTFTEAA